MSENYYNILGISENATKDEIKKAYRKLQLKHNPDRNGGSEESKNITQKLNEAYEHLSDDEKRQEYDMTRNNPNPFFRMNAHGPDAGMHMDDIFQMFFGGMPGMPGMPQGAKIHVFHGGSSPFGMHQALQKPVPIIKNMEITMEQVLNGATNPIEIERWILENGNKVFETETVYVTIPQGIDDGEIIILRDKGHVLNETSKGDVKIVIKINNTTIFKRSGLDLILERKISLKDALCGFSFEIKYINGKSYTLNNNKGNIIPPNYKKVYPNMGLKRGDHTGNMVIHFDVEFPEKLTEEQIAKLMAAL